MGLHINNELRDLISNYTLQKVYPVGAIYMSVNAVNPKDLFGFGTWEPIKGCYLVGVDASTTMEHNAPSKVFGSWNTHNTTLSINQIPGHTHWFGWSRHASQYSSDVNQNYNRSFATDNDEGTILMAHWCFDGNERIGYTSSEGGSQGHNHYFIPPSFSVYMWKRVA